MGICVNDFINGDWLGWEYIYILKCVGYNKSGVVS